VNRNIIKSAAIISTAIFVGLIVFQLLLALGFPMGRAAWGGEYEILPTSLRIGSLISAFILFFASYLVLSRAEIINDFGLPRLSKYGVLVLAGFFSINTLANLISQSNLERMIMAPIALTLNICCFILFFCSK